MRGGTEILRSTRRSLLGLLLWIGLVATAMASIGRPVIVPGREPEILALVRPHGLEDELAPGWSFHSVAIDQGTIHLWITGPEEAFAHVSLDHPDHAPDHARITRGFAVAVVARPPGSEAAVEALVEAIERNDDGSFWQNRPAVTRDPDSGPRLPKTMEAWLSDGLSLFAALAAIVVGQLVRLLRSTPSWMAWTLGAITIAGALLRVTLPVETAMAPWPYTRALFPARLIYEGPGLSTLHPGPTWLTGVVMTTVWCLGIVAPVAVYVHARYLLAAPRAALVAAGVLAILPIHLRFSHSDVAFIPSITLSSIAFALVHAATRERTRWALGLALVPLPLVVALTYVVRPLNLLYFPLLLATAFVNEGLRASKDPPTRLRIAVVALSIGAATFGIGVPHLLAEFGPQVREALGPGTLAAAAEVLLSPRFNALLNPEMTPPGFTLLALLGGVDLLRRRRRRLFAFVVGWLLALLVAHAYVVPIEPHMQARYHLHLVVPFVLLIACGFEGVLDRVARRWRHRLVAVFVVYAIASPWIHLGFIRDVERNDMLEWRFVHDLRETIPAGCTILEYTGDGASPRFARVGTYVEDRFPRTRWKIIATDARPETPPLSEEALEVLRDPPECLYYYQGLPCFGMKPPELPAAPACDAILGYHTPIEVASTTFDSRPYDDNMRKGLGGIEHIRLVLYRLDPEGSPSSFGRGLSQ